MIVTVTLNPSLDRTLRVARLNPGANYVTPPARLDLGGKGINVSRALRLLGIDSEIVAVLGGPNGQRLHAGLDEMGFRVHPIFAEDETRENIAVQDERGEVTKFNEPGAALNERQVGALSALIAARCRPGDLWAFCGSLPPGGQVDLYARLAAQVVAKGGLACLDSSGAPLAAACSPEHARHWLMIKPNSAEAAQLLGQPLVGDDAHLKAAQTLVSRGARLACITRGAEGLALAGAAGAVLAFPPAVEACCAVGAGDAAMAGLIWAWLDGCDLAQSAARAVAFGTAAAMQDGTGLGTREQVEALIPQVRVVSG